MAAVPKAPMLRRLLDKLLGAPTSAPLDRAAADGDPAVFKVRGKPYTPPAGSIEPARMNEKQRLVADIFLIRVKAYCEANGYDPANFRGPYLWAANDADGRMLAATVLGECSDPAYEAWQMEVASPHGTIGAVGDSRGESKVYRDGMYLPPRG